MGKYDELVERLLYQADTGDMGREPDPDSTLRKAATAITTLEAELAEAKAEIERLADNGCHLEMLLAAMKARGDRLAEYAVHRRGCPIVKGWRQAGNCHCGLKQALTEWRDQHHGGNDADT